MHQGSLLASRLLAIFGLNWLSISAGIWDERSGIMPTAWGTKLLCYWSAAFRYAPPVAFAIWRSTSPSLWRRLVRNEFWSVSVVIWIPTSRVTPKVTARIALRFFVFLLERDLQAINRLDFSPIFSPNKAFAGTTPNQTDLVLSSFLSL